MSNMTSTLKCNTSSICLLRHTKPGEAGAQPKPKLYWQVFIFTRLLAEIEKLQNCQSVKHRKNQSVHALPESNRNHGRHWSSHKLGKLLLGWVDAHTWLAQNQLCSIVLVEAIDSEVEKALPSGTSTYIDIDIK